MQWKMDAGKHAKTLGDGVTKLTLVAESKQEARALKLLKDGLYNNLGFWVPVLYAGSRDKIPKRLDDQLSKLVKAIDKDYMKEIGR